MLSVQKPDCLIVHPLRRKVGTVAVDPPVFVAEKRIEGDRVARLYRLKIVCKQLYTDPVLQIVAVGDKYAFTEFVGIGYISLKFGVFRLREDIFKGKPVVRLRKLIVGLYVLVRCA